MPIFISYRREDSESITHRIHEHLQGEFGSEDLFLDIDNIPAGANFVKHIHKELERCDVVLAVIGRNWAIERLREDNDYLRTELEIALQRELHIVPVLVERADMPKSSALPASLQPLVLLNAVRVDSSRDFKTHIKHLADSIRTWRNDRERERDAVAQAEREREAQRAHAQAEREREAQRASSEQERQRAVLAQAEHDRQEQLKALQADRDRVQRAAAAKIAGPTPSAADLIATEFEKQILERAKSAVVPKPPGSQAAVNRSPQGRAPTPTRISNEPVVAKLPAQKKKGLPKWPLFGGALLLLFTVLRSVLVTHPTTGTLHVEAVDEKSMPVRAQVLLDGHAVCFVTPCTLPGLETGSHHLRVIGPGRDYVKADLVIEGGPMQTERAVFTAVTSTLTVTSHSPRSHVFVDGIDRGYHPIEVSGLTPGKHTLRTVVDGDHYEPYEVEVNLEPGKTLQVEAKPVQKPPQPTLRPLKWSP